MRSTTASAWLLLLVKGVVLWCGKVRPSVRPTLEQDWQGVRESTSKAVEAVVKLQNCQLGQVDRALKADFEVWQNRMKFPLQPAKTTQPDEHQRRPQPKRHGLSTTLRELHLKQPRVVEQSPQLETDQHQFIICCI